MSQNLGFDAYRPGQANKHSYCYVSINMPRSVFTDFKNGTNFPKDVIDFVLLPKSKIKFLLSLVSLMPAAVILHHQLLGRISEINRLLNYCY